MAPPHIIIAGAPASGKGTQCEYIAAQYGVIHLSTGDMLRTAVQEATVIGKQAKMYMSRGELIPDNLIIDLVLDRLQEPDCVEKGWLLDGFPRSENQAKALIKAGATPHVFVNLQVPESVLVDRVVGRRNDPVTGKIYHMTTKPPENEEIAARLVQREDDTEEKCKVRVATYNANNETTMALFSNYVTNIDGNKKPDFVWRDTRRAISRALKWQVVFVLGGPGSGKGTQCAKIKEAYNYAHLSTGDLLRSEVEQGGPLSDEINMCMAEGKLVSDELVVKLVRVAMEKSKDTQKFLIDGFPRSLENLTAWNKIMGDDCLVDFVLCFDCPMETMRQRLLKRGETSGRADDNEESIAQRFKVFREQSEVVLTHFQNTGKVRTISSIPTPTKVFQAVSQLFNGMRLVSPYQRTLGIIKPDAVAQGPGTIKAILETIANAGLAVVGAKFVQLDDFSSGEFYLEHSQRPFYVGLKEFMSSGPAMVLVIEGSDAILAWRALMGPTNALKAKEEAPTSLRGRFGTDGTQNATHGSDSEASAMREINYFYLEGQTGVSTEVVSPYHKDIHPIDFCEENTYAMIKPVTAELNAAEIKEILLAHGFTIESEIFLTFSEALVGQFYSEHVGKTFFPRLSAYMQSGPVIGLKLKRIAAIYGWRQLIGPTNMEKCKEERGESIRALFAMDGTRNATHGSDSPESAARELAFMFGLGGQAPSVYPDGVRRAIRWSPPKPKPSPEKPPSEAYKKRVPAVLNMREHKKMMRYIRSTVDPVVRGLVQRAAIKKPTNMLQFALEDLLEQKRLGVGAKKALPPVGADGMEAKAGSGLEQEQEPEQEQLPATLDAAVVEIRELRASLSAMQLGGGLDSTSFMTLDDDSVLTEGAIATGMTHFF